MNSGYKPWAVPKLVANSLPRKRTPLLIGIISLSIVLLVSFLATAKTVTVEVDGKKIQYFTVRKSVGEFLNHTKLNVYPEDLVLPGRETPIQKGLQILVQRSIPITIKLDGQTFAFRTLSPVVGQALEGAGRKFGFRLKYSDEVEPNVTSVIQPNLNVEVRRSIPITVIADGVTNNLEMAPRTVKEVLTKQGINLGSKDLVTPNPDELITANTAVTVVRVTEKVMTVQSKLPFQIVAKPGDFPLGLPDRLISKGSPGLGEQVVKVTYEDGVEVDRLILSQTTLSKPVDQIVARGAQTTVSRGGRSINFKRALLVQATGYSDPGATTSLGVAVRKGVVAVDPRVIPYYSKLYIDGYNGWGEALDTGGVIKGNRIDLYFETREEAINWGRRTVVVYIL